MALPKILASALKRIAASGGSVTAHSMGGGAAHLASAESLYATDRDGKVIPASTLRSLADHGCIVRSGSQWKITALGEAEATMPKAAATADARKKEKIAKLDRDVANAIATQMHVRRKWASAFFHRDWNSWTVGYHTEGKTGGADAFTTAPNEAAAKQIAEKYNAVEEKYAKERADAVTKAKKARARFK